jgi:hypothetical protein
MATLPIGICALCRNKRELHNSHFLPKALYRLTRAAGKRNPHSVRITSKGRRQTAFQARTHLLCSDCERRFDSNGENWVMKNCYRGRGIFRLRSIVERLNPIEPNSEFVLYSAADVPGIDIDQITYFCSSVFWRASIQDWNIEGQKYQSISLGNQYGEEIRRYLLGLNPFPENAVVNIVLSKLNFPALFFNFPDSIRTDDGWCHRLHIPGISFILTIGKHSIESRNLCFQHSPSHPITISTLGDAHVQRGILRLMGKVAPKWGEYPLIEGVES